MSSVVTAYAVFGNDRIVTAGIYPDGETAWETVTNAIATGLEKVFGYSLEEALEVGLVECVENESYSWVGVMPEVKAKCSPEVAERFHGVWGFGFIDKYAPQEAFTICFLDDNDTADYIYFDEA